MRKAAKEEMSELKLEQNSAKQVRGGRTGRAALGRPACTRADPRAHVVVAAATALLHALRVRCTSLRCTSLRCCPLHRRPTRSARRPSGGTSSCRMRWPPPRRGSASWRSRTRRCSARQTARSARCGSVLGGGGALQAGCMRLLLLLLLLRLGAALPTPGSHHRCPRLLPAVAGSQAGEAAGGAAGGPPAAAGGARQGAAALGRWRVCAMEHGGVFRLLVLARSSHPYNPQLGPALRHPRHAAARRARRGAARPRPRCGRQRRHAGRPAGLAGEGGGAAG